MILNMIQYYSGIFDIDIINSLITNIPWEQMKLKGNRTLPRLVASLSPQQLVSYVPETISIIDNVNTNIGNIRSCWLNLYRDGNDYTPYHRDSYNCKVLNISFGGIRKFSYKNNNGGELTHMI